MKRTNVILDEKLLEEARKVTGERTYSGAITKALEEYVRRHSAREAIRKWLELAQEGPMFRDGYLEEIRPNSYAALAKQRISADEHRIAKKKSRRGTR